VGIVFGASGLINQKSTATISVRNVEFTAKLRWQLQQTSRQVGEAHEAAPKGLEGQCPRRAKEARSTASHSPHIFRINSLAFWNFYTTAGSSGVVIHARPSRSTTHQGRFRRSGKGPREYISIYSRIRDRGDHYRFMADPDPRGVLIGTTDWRGLCQRTGVAMQPLKAAQPRENAERSWVGPTGYTRSPRGVHTSVRPQLLCRVKQRRGDPHRTTVVRTTFQGSGHWETATRMSPLCFPNLCTEILPRTLLTHFAHESHTHIPPRNAFK